MYILENLRQTSRRYALDEYIIHPDYKNNKVLENWIENIALEQAEVDGLKIRGKGSNFFLQ